MKDNKNFSEKNIVERELINELEGVFGKTPILVNYKEQSYSLEDTVKESFYQSVCDAVKAKLFEAKDELANCTVIEMQDRVSKIDAVLNSVKIGEDVYKFQKANGRAYEVEGREEAIKFLTSYVCPSEYGMEDSRDDNDGEWFLNHQCKDCWNEPMLSEQELLKKVKDNVSKVLDRVIMAGIKEAEKATLNKCAEKKVKKQPTHNKEVKSKLDLAIKKHYREDTGCLKYCGLTVTEGELRHQLMHHSCPSYFGLQDECEDNVQERIRQIVSMEECTRCWEMPENIKSDAEVETVNNKDLDRREVLNDKKFLNDCLSIKFLGNEYDLGFGTSCEFNIDSKIKPMLKVEEREHHDDPNFGGTDAYVEMTEGRIEKNEETGEIVIWIFEPTMNNGGKFLHEIDKVLHYDKQELQDEIVKRWIEQK